MVAEGSYVLIVLLYIFQRLLPCKTSYIQSAEQLSFVCLIEQAGSGEADKTLSLQARGGE